ncbi:unnamed protein product, partial [Owenia fusiformis]
TTSGNMLVKTFCMVLREIQHVQVQYVKRYSSKELKRFYKNVTVTQAEGRQGFEINLDKRKLRTPMGTVLQIPSEPLALAVQAEWEAQDQVIHRPSMHLTSLCNTAQDNPTKRSREVVVGGMLEYLNTDTICYRMDEPQELHELQKAKWDPLLDWAKERYNIVLEPTVTIAQPLVPAETVEVFRQHLQSYSDWSLIGFQTIVEALKSVILTMALVDRYTTVETAVDLSRLELNYQIGKWGNVEWHHDIELTDLYAKVSASLLCIHLTSEDTFTKHKTIAGQLH